MRAKVEWREDEPGIAVSSEAELRYALEVAADDAARRPLMVDVVLENGDTVSVGLGSDVSVLSFAGGSGNPPYFSSRGRGPDADPVVFDYYGHMSEFAASAAIPFEDAVDAVVHFCEHGDLSSQVRWVEV